MEVPMLDLKQQYLGYKEQVLDAIKDVCDTQQLALGPAVAEFEKNIAQYCGCKYALGVSSGTDALLMALMAIEVKAGDEVITTPFTFFATAGSVYRVGARAVFVDIKADTFNIDPDLIEAEITEKTKAIMPVHLYGQAAQTEPIMEIAERYDISVIEDACQAIGAEQNGVKCGNLGHIGCFSFYPTKNLGGFGDSGLVTTNDEKLAEKMKSLRNHGQGQSYIHEFVGGNFRMDGIQGAVLNTKLKFLESWSQKRRDNAQIYNRMLDESPVTTPITDENNIHIFHQYTIRAPQRDRLKQYLADKGIGSAVFYPLALHLQKCFSELGYVEGDFPVAEQACREVLSLPIYPELTQEQIEYVAQSILNFYSDNENAKAVRGNSVGVREVK